MTSVFRKRLPIWWFVLLTAGIGGTIGLSVAILYGAESLGSIVMVAWLVGIGATFGFFMGIPADIVVRLVVPRLRHRWSAVLFCFGLGYASAIASVVAFLLWSSGGSWRFTGVDGPAVLFLLVFGLPAGILTACATSRIVEPVTPRQPKVDRLTGLPL
ncbi:Uncharacterised protein [Mycobacteroides abscessus subsp. abscessus]|nr:Uncharacterised protein [Mycobacteroides abscessus subsp. abscessus]